MSTVTAPQIATSTWNIDPAHSVAEFKVKHMMISNVKGQFTGVAGTLTLDEAEITNSKIEATIDAASINTREPQRDAHLKSADFFDVEKFPALSFKSARVLRKSSDELEVEGELTIHGVTRKVQFAVESWWETKSRSRWTCSSSRLEAQPESRAAARHQKAGRGIHNNERYMNVTPTS
jgi:polyisoprenoid-binding protein YceI